MMLVCYPDCPDSCRCDPSMNGVSIQCGLNSPLAKLPDTLPVDVVELRISGTNITTITKDFLSQCNNLILLDFSNNNISLVEMSAFDDLSELKTLVLSNNRLFYNETSFPNKVIQRLVQLETLDLKENKKERSPNSSIVTTWNDLKDVYKFFSNIPENVTH